ncbi:unnamed protein product, partial [Rangifer tarandus platyrhynchus]
MGGGVRSGAAPAQNIQIITFQTITCHLRPAASARELPCVGVTGVHTQRRVCVTQQRYHHLLENHKKRRQQKFRDGYTRGKTKEKKRASEQLYK